MSRLLVATALLFTTGAALAQDGHDHDHAATQDTTPPVVAPTHDHGSTASSPPPMLSTDHETMGHGTMPMGSDTAPADARDPHAYSGGFTRTVGPYALNNAEHDTHHISGPILSILGDRLEYDPDTDTGSYDLQAWYGTSFNRLIINLHNFGFL